MGCELDLNEQVKLLEDLSNKMLNGKPLDMTPDQIYPAEALSLELTDMMSKNFIRGRTAMEHTQKDHENDPHVPGMTFKFSTVSHDRIKATINRQDPDGKPNQNWVEFAFDPPSGSEFDCPIR